MLEDYSFKYILKLLSERIDHEDLGVGDLFDYFHKINKSKSDYSVKEKECTAVDAYRRNPYIPESYKKTIQGFQKSHSYQVRYANWDIDLNIHSNDENIQELLHHILGVLSFMTGFSVTNKKFGIHIYLTDYKKFVSKGNYTPEGINSGSTDRVSILIWRKEDILKVLIHEMIHLLGFDAVEDGKGIVDHYNDRYDLGNKKLNIFEAYTEVWALLIHCYYIATITHSSVRSGISLEELFFDYILIEKCWCNELGGRILTLFRSGEDVDAHTNTMSYYVIKTEILNDLKGFMNLCRDPALSLKMDDNDRFLSYLKNLKKIEEVKMLKTKISSVMVINSLKISY